MQPPAANRDADPDPAPAGVKTIVPGDFRPAEPRRAEGWRGGASFNFQPLPEVLKRHLATRKHPFNLGGITFPGLFGEQTADGASRTTGDDLGWFKVAVIAEIITATILSVIVVNVFGLPFYAGLLPLAGILGLDGLLAILHHWPADNRCLRENQELLVVRDLRAGTWSSLDAPYGNFLGALATKTPGWHRWLPTLCALLIALVAVGKTFFLAANIQEIGTLFRPAADGNLFASHSSLDDILQRGEYRAAVLVIFGLLYLLVAYIHIRHTGYALAAMRLTAGLKRDWAQMNQNPADPRFRCVPHRQTVNLRELAEQLSETKDAVYTARVPSAAKLPAVLKKGLHVNLSPEEQGAIAPHTIGMEEDGETYNLTRLGVLTDRQLAAWVNMQPTDFAQLAMALYGHALQLELIGGENIDKDIL